MNWGTIRIAKACLPTQLRDPKRDPDKSFLYVDISAIDRTLKVITSAPEILGADAPSRARKEIRKGDVLVSTVRPNLNAVAVVPPDLDGQIASTGFCVLRPDCSLIEGKYLFYYTLTPEFIGILSSKVRGAHYPAVSDDDVKEMELPLPSLTEQRRIVEILDQADVLRKKRAEADAKAARILPTLFYTTFGDPATNPRSWQIAKLETVADIGTQLVDPNESQFLDLPHIGGEQIEKETGRILSPKLVRESDLRSDKFHFTSDHILYSKIRPYLNKVAFPRFEGVCSADIYPIRPRNGRVSHWYLVALLRSPAFLAYAKAYSERLRMAKLNREQLGAFPTPLPDPAVLEIFEKRAEQIQCLEKTRFEQADRVSRLFKVLLHRAFIGDLTAKWRETHMKKLLAEMEAQAKSLEDST